MKRDQQSRRRSEKGIALLIAIFVLLLISVVAIALLVSSGTETQLGANYRSSSTAYYAALAGLEEARGRLLPRNPSYLGTTYIPIPFPVNQNVYLTNSSGGGDVVAPWDPGNIYYDKEYQQEFGVAASTVTYQAPPSLWDNNAQGIPGPLFKWVRINAATRQSIHTDVDNNNEASFSAPPLYYDLEHVDFNGQSWPSLIVNPSPPPTAGQALELTAFAYLPNGSKKMLQYLVTPIFPSLSFPSALTLSGNNVIFSAPNSSNFKVDGTDHAAPGICSPGASPPSVAAVGYTNNSDSSQSHITTAITAANRPNYAGLGGTTPNVSPVGGLLAGYLQNAGQLENFVQAISQNADVTISGPATQSDMPSAMSATNPMTIVVNGDLTFNGWHSTGYGILLVTGTFTFDPDASWDGIVLVVGKGEIYTHQAGVGQFDGALFLAKTVDSLGNPLPPSSALGSPYFHFTAGAGSTGVYYSSCLVNWAQATLTYKVLSFHEIPQ